MLLRVCACDDLQSGEMTTFTGYREPIAVYRVGDEFYATADLCTHGKSSLSEEGELDGYEIECGWHFGRFDIRTGDVKAMPCTQPLKTYPVTIQDGAVFVEVEEG